jgi:hypothetical protein
MQVITVLVYTVWLALALPGVHGRLASIEVVDPTTAPLAADATCQLVAQYTGSFDEGPVWTGNYACAETRCPRSGDCIGEYVSLTPTSLLIECQCPSGGGNDGCRGQLQGLRDAQGNWSYKLRCTGGCGQGQTCDWDDAPTPSGMVGGDWARCRCQP